MAIKRVAVIGASGYGGLQSLRLLQSHPDFEITLLGGGRSAGNRWSELCPFLPLADDPQVESPDPERISERADAVLLSLPNGLASGRAHQAAKPAPKPTNHTKGKYNKHVRKT